MFFIAPLLLLVHLKLYPLRHLLVSAVGVVHAGGVMLDRAALGGLIDFEHRVIVGMMIVLCSGGVRVLPDLSPIHGDKAGGALTPMFLNRV